LVAPLLGPLMGLSLALAVGDSRLALQSAAVVGGSLIAVIATAAALTAVLPFHVVTLEISSRIHPTTLDLGVAVCSGLVGAVVTVARGERLSAAIPGVAVAVALIPPLGVAGFGVAAGWQTDVIWGSLLLLGANLAGIVLSAMAVFLLIGMHRSDVVEAARRWHEGATPNGIARQICRLPGVGRAGVFGSALARVGLVLAFVLAIAVPLSAALMEVVRETRVRGAVEEALTVLEAQGTSIMGHQVDLGPDSATARVRVTTTMGVSPETRAAFRRQAGELAGEPVQLSLEQLPVSAGDGSALQALLRGGNSGGVREEDAAWPETVASARARLEEAVWALPFPAGVEAIGVTLRVGSEDGVVADSAEVEYLAPAPLEPQAVEVLGRTLRRAVGHEGLRTSFVRVGPAVLAVGPADSVALDSVLSVLGRHNGLRVGIRSTAADSAAAMALLERIRASGVDAVTVERRSGAGPLELRVSRTGS
ncbi:MAG TPA: DUF389 domain-containing protein, partial [Longimicrobiales bacterium]|nr:DUF389 domain-containing protein [Longimicrobiales bacterium]